MKEVIEILKFCKKSIYENNEDICKKIDSAIEILEGKEGKAHSDVIEALESVKKAYDSQDMKEKITEAIKTLEG